MFCQASCEQHNYGNKYVQNNISPNFKIRKQKESRSRSLEPNQTIEFRGINEFKFLKSRYKSGKYNTKLENLWNPEEQHLEIITKQLQNPSLLSCQNDEGKALITQKKICSISQLKETEFDEQLKLLYKLNYQNRKNNDYVAMNNNLTEQEELYFSITGLTIFQTHILQKIWWRTTESEIMECTCNIFSHLLRSNVQMYHFFDLVGKNEKEIILSTIFARQSANFAIVFDYVISNITNIKKVCFVLQCLGERHTRLKYPIETTHWMLFSRVMQDNPPKLVFQNGKGHYVWKTMIEFIIQQIQIGYDRAIGEFENELDYLDKKHYNTSLMQQKSNSQIKKQSIKMLDEKQDFNLQDNSLSISASSVTQRPINFKLNLSNEKKNDKLFWHFRKNRSAQSVDSSKRKMFNKNLNFSFIE